MRGEEANPSPLASKKAKKSIGCLVCLSYWHHNSNEFPTNFDFVQHYVRKLALLFRLIENLL